MCTPRNLKLSTFSTTVPSMWIGGCSLGCHLLPVGRLVVVDNQAVVLSANLMIELEACMATQSWVNREYRRGLRTHPCGAPLLRISEVEMLFPTLNTWGQTVRKSRTNDEF
jgi:hypothetical protein